MHTDVHPEEDVQAWEAPVLWGGCLTSAAISAGTLYVVARWLVLPVFRRIWPLVQPWVAAYGGQLLTAALLAVVVMAIFAIAREK